MAKIKMLCPFSKKLCTECPLYRGRHYYLCFHSKYRGSLGNSEELIRRRPQVTRTSESFEMPPTLPPNPTWLALNDFAERAKI